MAFRRVFWIVSLIACFHSFSGSASELHQAARKGELAKVSDLISKGTDLNLQDGEGATALFIASGWGQTDIVTLLLKSGADPMIAAKSPYGSGGTAIHIASQRGHVEIVRALLDHGVDPNLNDPRLGPPLHIARLIENDDVVALLVERGAKSQKSVSVNALIKDADMETGRTIAAGCEGCHDLTSEPSETTKEGPTLWEIVGRKKAAVADFEYSTTLAQMGGNWTYDDLNSLVADAMAYVPGTKMYGVAPVTTRERRAALLLFLRSLSAEPAPLP